MGLFDKKYCDVCGEKIGLLGNRKLEDGNLCKNCAGKLSVWFSERRHSTIESIKSQLKMREDNKVDVAAFVVTRELGVEKMVFIDETKKKFLIANTRNFADSNPDVFDAKQITNVRYDVSESKHELKYNDNEGKQTSYNPPQYSYSYMFHVIITLNHPYVDEIRFMPIGSVLVEPTDGQLRALRYNPPVNAFLGMVTELLPGQQSPTMDPEYQRAEQLCNEIVGTLLNLRNDNTAPAVNQNAFIDNIGISQRDMGAQPVQQMQTAQPVYPTNGEWICPGCRAKNSGNFCEFCGTPRG